MLYFLASKLPFEAWDLSHLRCGFSVCFSVNCLHPWVCSHALPDVLAARLHSCPAPTSPGLLLVRPSLCVHYLCVFWRWVSVPQTHSTVHIS